MLTRRLTLLGSVAAATLLALTLVLVPTQQTGAYTQADSNAFQGAQNAFLGCEECFNAYQGAANPITPFPQGNPESTWAYQGYLYSYYGWYFCYYGSEFSNQGSYYYSVICYFYACYCFDFAQTYCFNTFLEEYDGQAVVDAFYDCNAAFEDAWLGANQFLPL